MYFSKNSQLIVVLCGSISPWIEKNILSNTGFFGRITLDLTLQELPLSAFWHPKEQLISSYKKFKILSVTGGVPLYLEQIRPDISAEENIRDLCFTLGGLLVREFEEIFSDLFSRKNASYKEIVTCIADGPKELKYICKALGKSPGGVYSRHLDNLVKAGFIQRDFTWDMKNGKEGKLSCYRLSDNYLRFYLKYITPNLSKIEKGNFTGFSLTRLQNWEGIMGLQFENLVVHNRKELWKLLNLSPEEIEMDGPFFQKKTAKHPGCQIDYMIQTRFNALFLCEIKFSKRAVGISIIKEMEEKRRRLVRPKFCSIRPVLIHVNGVEESVLEANYFDKVIDFGELIT